MKDLEIRGAGNILGAEQSGQILAVGYELYTRLLAQAVQDLKLKREAGDLSGLSPDTMADAVRDGMDESLADHLVPEPGVALDLGIPAGIPEDYVPDLSVRLGLYQRLVKLQDANAIDSMADELRDRFGPMPWEAQALLYSVRLKTVSSRAGVESISRRAVASSSG